MVHPGQVGSLSQADVERQTSTATFKPADNLESPVNTPACFWTVGKSSMQSELMQAQVMYYYTSEIHFPSAFASYWISCNTYKMC